MVLIYLSGLVLPRVLARATTLALPAGPSAPFLQVPTLTSLSQVLFRLFVNQFSAVLFAMVFLFVLTLLRMVLRRDWLASLVWAAILAAPIVGEGRTIGWVAGGLRALILLLVLRRGGLLSLAVALFYMFSLIEVPITLDFAAWYAPRALPVVGVAGRPGALRLPHVPRRQARLRIVAAWTTDQSVAAGAPLAAPSSPAARRARGSWSRCSAGLRMGA